VTTGLGGRVVLITGASSGIGAATARAAATAGMSVMLTARRGRLLEELAKEIRSRGGKAAVFAADLRKQPDIDAMIAFALSEFGGIDVLVANAGVSCHAPVAGISDAELEAVFEVNALGAMRSVRAVLPHMLARGSGQVIVVTSVATGLVWPDDAVYGASKAAVSRFARGLRRDVAAGGVFVTEVVPGVVATDLAPGLSLLPKTEPDAVGRAMVNAMARPRRRVVVPWWYRVLLLLNRLIPGSVDAMLRRSRE